MRWNHTALLILIAAFVCLESGMAEITPLTEEDVQGHVESTELLLPSPPEVFAAFSRSAKPKWRAHYLENLTQFRQDREMIAFQIGILVGEAYLAAEVGEGQRVRNLVSEIESRAEALGGGEAMKGRVGTMHRFSDNNEWNAIRFELGALEGDLASALSANRDSDLAYLITTGIWVRVLEIAVLEINHNEKISPEILVKGLRPLMVSLKARFDLIELSNRDTKNLRKAIKDLIAAWEFEDNPEKVLGLVHKSLITLKKDLVAK